MDDEWDLGGEIPDPNPNIPTLIPIDLQGDVTLVARNGPKVRVSSSLLSLASSAFAAMFSGRWQEGLQLSREEPPEIELQDDNAEALIQVCLLLHHQPLKSGPYWDSPSPSATCEAILGMTVVADKYLFLKTIAIHLRSFVVRRLDDSVKKPSINELFKFFAVAYKLEDRVLYQRLSAALLIRVHPHSDLRASFSDNSFDMSDLGVGVAADLLPAMVPDLLLEGGVLSKSPLLNNLRAFVERAKRALSKATASGQNSQDLVPILELAQDVEHYVEDYDDGSASTWQTIDDIRTDCAKLAIDLRPTPRHLSRVEELDSIRSTLMGTFCSMSA